MRPPKEFQTERLWLRPVEEADALAIFAYAGQYGATQFMPFVRHERVEDSRAFTRRCIDAWKDGSAFPWAIIEKSGARFVGVIELRISPPKADFGYILTESHWGKGYATEAAVTVVAWALAQSSIFRIWATCHPGNAASARVLQKAGLAFEATLANWEARPQLGERTGPSLVFARIKAVTG